MNITNRTWWIAAGLLLQSGSAFAACVQTNNTVGLTGLDNNNGSVYAAVTSPGNQCGCGFVRFTPANTDTDKALSILLAAKLSNTQVRIDVLDENNCSTGYRVYLQ